MNKKIICAASLSLLLIPFSSTFAGGSCKLLTSGGGGQATHTKMTKEERDAKAAERKAKREQEKADRKAKAEQAKADRKAKEANKPKREKKPAAVKQKGPKAKEEVLPPTTPETPPADNPVINQEPAVQQ